jgi:hypothetical protein
VIVFILNSTSYYFKLCPMGSYQPPDPAAIHLKVLKPSHVNTLSLNNFIVFLSRLARLCIYYCSQRNRSIEQRDNNSGRRSNTLALPELVYIFNTLTLQHLLNSLQIQSHTASYLNYNQQSWHALFRFHSTIPVVAQKDYFGTQVT